MVTSGRTHTIYTSLCIYILYDDKSETDDKNALTKLSVSNQHTSYMNTHGIASKFKKGLSDKLKGWMCSLNDDEPPKTLNGLHF